MTLRQPTEPDHQRSERQTTFWALVHSDYGKDDEIVQSFLRALIGDSRMALWGPPDTSGNVLMNFAKQLSTPGLYGRPPRVSHPDQASIGETPFGSALRFLLSIAAPILPLATLSALRANLDAKLAEQRASVDHFLRLVEAAGLWSTGQERSRKAIGMGDALMMVGWSGTYRGRVATIAEGGRPALRFLRPQDCYVEVDPYNPDVPVVFAERCRRFVTETGRMEDVWDVYDVSDPKSPSFTVRRPNDKAGQPDQPPFGLSWTAGSAPASVGDDYPWRSQPIESSGEEEEGGETAQGTPVIPVVRWSPYDTLTFWHDLSVRDQARGALHSIAHWTYATRCARDASGSTVLLLDIEKPSGSVTNQGAVDQAASVPLEPGAFVFMQTVPGKQAQVHTIGPGANLEDVAGFALHYELEQFVRAGISPTDIQRVSADPASGAALAISNQGRREYAMAIEPAFRRADLRALQLMAIACARWGGQEYPETGYEIVYDVPPESPQAQQGRRDHMTWMREQGLRSRIDLYVAEHPGVSRQRAAEMLRRVRAEEAAIEAPFETPEKVKAKPGADMGEEPDTEETQAPLKEGTDGEM